MTEWIIEEAGPKTPVWNMETDRQKLEDLTEHAKPTLRFYEWSVPSATYGYFINPWEYFDPRGVEVDGLELARRPTGGGIIFHSFDVAFSLIVPRSHPFYALNSLQSYAAINQLILSALDPGMTLGETTSSRGGFCMAKPTQYDLMLGGKKVGGAAQRKTKKGLLHQGSICKQLPEKEWLKTVLRNGEEVFNEMEQMSLPLASTDIKEAIIRSICH